MWKFVEGSENEFVNISFSKKSVKSMRLKDSSMNFWPTIASDLQIVFVFKVWRKWLLFKIIFFQKNNPFKQHHVLHIVLWLLCSYTYKISSILYKINYDGQFSAIHLNHNLFSKFPARYSPKLQAAVSCSINGYLYCTSEWLLVLSEIIVPDIKATRAT